MFLEKGQELMEMRQCVCELGERWLKGGGGHKEKTGREGRTGSRVAR